MNLSLFKSIHGIMALVICIGCVAWLMIIGAEIGTRAGSDPGYVLWSGWIAAGLMLVAMLYCGRKYMHKLKYSPELKLKVPVASLEAADAGLNEIRRRIVRGDYSSMAEVKQAAHRVIQEEGVSKVIAVHVRQGNDAEGEPSFVIDVRPPEKYGRMTKWLHAHIYYGLASGVLVWLHGGFAMTHPMGIALNVLTIVVLVTGVIGLFLFAVGPSWLTRHEQDLNFEENFVLDASLRDKIRAHLAELKKALSGETEIVAALDTAFASGNHDRLTTTFQSWRAARHLKLKAASEAIDAVTTQGLEQLSSLDSLQDEPDLKKEMEAAIRREQEAAEKAEVDLDPKKVAAAMKKVGDAFQKKYQLVEDAVVLLGQRNGTRASLAELTRIKFYMNVWRAIHIPASLALCGLIVLHALSIWWY